MKAGTQADKQVGRHAGRQAGRQTDRQFYLFIPQSDQSSVVCTALVSATDSRRMTVFGSIGLLRKKKSEIWSLK
jgi:hypothetical protein